MPMHGKALRKAASSGIVAAHAAGGRVSTAVNARGMERRGSVWRIRVPRPYIGISGFAYEF